MEKINVLSFDTSGNDLKIGLSVDGNDAYFDEDTGLKHIENLLPQIDLIYKKMNADKSKTHFISVCNGPGSFTGIRIGIAAAYGLSLGSNLKCFGFSIFDVYQYLYLNKNFDVIVPVVDAKKQRFYCAFIEKDKPFEMFDITPEEINDKIKVYKNKKIVFTGRDFKLLKDKINLDIEFQHEYENGFNSKELIDYSKNFILSNKQLIFPKPIYLRKSEAEIELLKRNK